MKYLSLIISFSLTISACTSPSANRDQNQGTLFLMAGDTAYNNSCPFLTSGPHGNTVLSWVKEINDSSASLCYTIFSDNAKSFSRTAEIHTPGIRPHGENMPKLVFKPNGSVIAMWGVDNANAKSKYAGLIYYCDSKDGGNTWNDARPLVKDTSSYDQRYFDIALLPSGEVCAVWLDSRKKTDKSGSTLYYAVTSSSNEFTNELPVAETICQCCRTDLFIDQKGKIHITFRDIMNDSIRDMVHTVSADGGKTFSEPQRISADNWVIDGCPHTGPTIGENKNGLHFAWYTMGNGSGVYYCQSPDNGNTFSARDSVSSNPTARHPQLITMDNGNILIVWDESLKKGEEFYNRIGMQERSPEGKIIFHKYITPDTGHASYPVIQQTDSGMVLVVYTERINEKEQLRYQLSEIAPVAGL